jgi:hypothetical protein
MLRPQPAHIKSVYAEAVGSLVDCVEQHAISILYAITPNLTAVSDWLPSYHEARLVRLLSLPLIIGVLWPAIWSLLTTVFRLVRRWIKYLDSGCQRQRFVL